MPEQVTRGRGQKRLRWVRGAHRLSRGITKESDVRRGHKRSRDVRGDHEELGKVTGGQERSGEVTKGQGRSGMQGRQEESVGGHERLRKAARGQ